MNVLSLFDGMSCGQIALNNLGIKPNYFASEIDKYSIKITKKNFSNTTHIGDVTKIQANDLPRIDLLIGGSPCQGFSYAGDGLNFEDDRSKLFFEFVRLLKGCKPRWFLLENVKMKKEWEDIITSHLGVKPAKINSSIFSAQSRERLYWTNIGFEKIDLDLKINLKDIIEDIPYNYVDPNTISVISKHSSDSGLICVGGLNKVKRWTGGSLQRSFSQGERIYSIEGKSPCLSASSGGTAGRCNALITDDITKFRYRKLTITECEKLQTVPVEYTSGVSESQRRKMLGNGWTVKVIEHILKGIL